MKSKPLALLSITIFVWSSFILIIQYLSTFATFSLPSWLGVFVLGATIESSYFAAYFLNPRTPLLVRLIEISMWVLPLYFLLGGLQPVFWWSCLAILVPWFVAREYGVQLRKIESLADFLGDQAASTVRWEYESIQHRSNQPTITEYFWSRFWFFNSLIVLLAIVTNKEANLLLWALTLTSGLTLQGLVYLFRLEILWSYGQVQVQDSIAKKWLHGLLILVGMTLLIALILPHSFSPLTAVEVGQFMSGILGRITSSPGLPLPPEGERPPVLPQGPEQLPPESGFSLMGLLFAGLFFLILVSLGLFILFVIGWLIVTFVDDELQRLKGLPRLALRIYTAFLNNWRKLREGVQFNLSTVENRAIPTPSRPRGLPKWRKRPKGIRGMFKQLVQGGKAKGLTYVQSQPPSSYGQILSDHLPEEQEKIEEFMAGYEQERYGERSLNPEERAKLLAKGAEIIDQLKR